MKMRVEEKREAEARKQKAAEEERRRQLQAAEAQLAPLQSARDEAAAERLALSGKLSTALAENAAHAEKIRALEVREQRAPRRPAIPPERVVGVATSLRGEFLAVCAGTFISFKRRSIKV